ncbi:MAG: hypothetical protein A2Y14_01400 [Verrucomicrobia bacterium GWF2_51_19]|nr:MAG: hypothetical protein A2Y14_01400 [Verrucomicrobia bacterium GWF2_51_19]HCJ11728.1 hypothetical protein [Opitutae bacterium]
MNANIGERFEEARKQQGISLREASDTTKIRKDFLQSFEKNDFDIALPEVYRRGFVRLYAKYLKMDVESILTDYNAFVLGSSKLGKKEGQFFGRMELTERDKSLPTPFLDTPAQEELAPANNKETAQPAAPHNKALYLRTGLIFGGTFAAILLIGILINSFFGTKSKTQNAISDTTLVAQEAGADTTLSLIGSDDVQVFVRQEKDKKPLFTGTLHKGEQKIITPDGFVKISFSKGSNLVIKKANGELIRPQSDGVGWVSVR